MQVHNNCSSSNSCRSLQQLPTALQLHIWSLLPPNERALSGRLLCRDARDALHAPHHSTALLSQPIPPHAAPWAKGAGQQHVRRLPFRHKPLLLCTAAASGSEANLEVAWAWLQPSLCQEPLKVCQPGTLPDPGEAAVRAGHPQLLGWLVRRCPGLLHPDRILQAAAQQCDLAGLKRVWQVLSEGLHGTRHCRSFTQLDEEVLDAAAASGTPDAVVKMELLLSRFWASCHLRDSTAEAAARSGDLGRLQWLRGRGCRMRGRRVLRTALQHADLAVAKWLLAEARCELPEATHRAAAGPGAGPSAAEQQWADLFQSAATGSDGVAKLQWLREKGAPQVQDMHVSLQQDIALTAVRAGRVEAVRHLLSYWPPGAVLPVSPEQAERAAAASGSISMADFVRGAGAVFGPRAYYGAAEAGCVDMVRWLVREAGVPVKGVWLREVIRAWPDRTPADARGLLQAVQLLVGAGHVSWSPKLDVASAVQRGDLALVQYLVQQQQQQQQQHTCVPDWLPSSRTTVAAVVAGGCAALLEWLAEQDPRFREALRAAGTSLYSGALETFDKAMLAALAELLVQ